MSTKILIDNRNKNIEINGASATLPTSAQDGSILVSDSSNNWVAAPTYSSWRNRIINGDMRIVQRGIAAVSADAAFPVDRWRYYNGTSATASAQQSSDAPTGFSNSYRMTVTTGATATAAQYAQMSQSIEGTNIVDLGWGTASAKPITLSFWVKSSLAGTYCVSIRNSAANRTYIAPYTISGAGWQRKTLTIPGDTSGTWLSDTGIGIRVLWDWGTGSNFATPTANAWVAGNFAYATGNQANLIGTTGATFHLTGVQLEPGEIATPFELRPIQTELDLCRRYYVKMNSTNGNYVAYGTSVYALDRYVVQIFPFPDGMRATPTFNAADAPSLLRSGNRLWTPGGAASPGGSWPAAPTYYFTTNSVSMFVYTNNSSTNYQSRFEIITANNTTAEFIEFNAEL